MTRPNVIIANCKTGKIVTREMNDDEYAQYLIDQETVTEGTNDEG